MWPSQSHYFERMRDRSGVTFAKISRMGSSERLAYGLEFWIFEPRGLPVSDGGAWIGSYMRIQFR